ncbi:MAG: PAS domain-containing protein, partial [Limisphaerales bacterium]
MPTPKTKALPQREVRMGSVWWGYVIAVAGTALGGLIRWALLQAIGYLPLYISFYPVVFAAAVVGGTRPGLLATILSALVVEFWFTGPVGSLSFNLADGVAVIFFVAVNVGISMLGGRLKAQSEALQEGKALLELTLHATGIGAFDRNLETDVNTWTPELEAMHGLKTGRFGRTGAAWEQLIHPDDRHIAFTAVERALTTLEPVEAEWRVVWPDGSVHWVMARFRAFPKSVTKAPRLVGINIDITARNMAAEALRQREEWFRTLADAIPQLSWIARPDGHVFWFNNRCFEYLGASQPQLEGSGWLNAVDPEVRQTVMEHW